MKPFLKWAGGKHRLVERICALLPPAARLVEPFVGSGAVFLNADYPACVLADANPDLINLYQRLRAGGEEFIAACGALFEPAANDRSVYMERRARFNATSDGGARAQLFVYLNKHCYNGLCRYNRRGEFNVPFGRYATIRFPADEMRAFQRKAQAATFLCDDYVRVMRQAGKGDVEYCDPPYVPLSATAHFTSYSATPFGIDAQETLAAEAQALAARGVPVLISNHDTATTRALYASAQIECFDVRRTISCSAASRGAASELLAYFAPCHKEGPFDE